MKVRVIKHKLSELIKKKKKKNTCKTHSHMIAPTHVSVRSSTILFFTSAFSERRPRYGWSGRTGCKLKPRKGVMVVLRDPVT